MSWKSVKIAVLTDSNGTIELIQNNSNSNHSAYDKEIRFVVCKALHPGGMRLT